MAELKGTDRFIVDRIGSTYKTSFEEIQNWMTDNFQVVWDLIDTNNDGEISLQDFIGCD